jgi:hypothetical protein
VDTEFNGEAEFFVGFFEGSPEFRLDIIGVTPRIGKVSDVFGTRHHR